MTTHIKPNPIAIKTYIAQTKNSMQSFINEESRIAVELLEGKVQSDFTISQKGKYNQYQDGVIEFIWKGKIAIVFRPEMTANGLESVAYHMYDEQARVSFSESQDI
jgi:hypothetical protein